LRHFQLLSKTLKNTYITIKNSILGKTLKMSQTERLFDDKYHPRLRSLALCQTAFGRGRFAALHLSVVLPEHRDRSLNAHYIRSLGAHYIRSLGAHYIRSLGAHYIRSLGAHYIRSLDASAYGLRCSW